MIKFFKDIWRNRKTPVVVSVNSMEIMLDIEDKQVPDEHTTQEEALFKRLGSIGVDAEVKDTESVAADQSEINIKVSLAQMSNEQIHAESFELSKHVWQDNDIITANDINRWEAGIDDGVSHANNSNIHISPKERESWNNLTARMDDTGWLNLSFANGVRSHGAHPQCRRIGNIVYLRGAFTGIQRNATVCTTLPVGFRPSGQSHPFIQNTSMQGGLAFVSRWQVRTNGDIELESVNRPDGFADGRWFPINTSFLID